jgi:hypothetical protein
MLRHSKAGDIGAIRAGLAIILILDASLCVTLWFSVKANRVAAVLLIPTGLSFDLCPFSRSD